jgi:hypothetical protein
MGAIDSVKVDSEADAILLQNELDHAATVEKIGRVADGEDVRLGDDSEIFAELSFFRRADEENFATVRLRNIGDAHDAYGTVIDGFVGCDIVDGAALGIAAEDAEIEGRTGAGRAVPLTRMNLPKLKR